MKALSIKQPWLWAITDLDKRIENRTWAPPAWIVGKRIALHASKGIDRSGMLAVYQIAREIAPSPLPLGCIVAVATVSACVLESESEWFFGPYGWFLSSVYKLPEPIPCSGALGLWEVPRGILEQFPNEWRFKEITISEGE